MGHGKIHSSLFAFVIWISVFASSLSFADSAGCHPIVRKVLRGVALGLVESTLYPIPLYMRTLKRGVYWRESKNRWSHAAAALVYSVNGKHPFRKPPEGTASWLHWENLLPLAVGSLAYTVWGTHPYLLPHFSVSRQTIQQASTDFGDTNDNDVIILVNGFDEREDNYLTAEEIFKEFESSQKGKKFFIRGKSIPDIQAEVRKIAREMGGITRLDWYSHGGGRDRIACGVMHGKGMATKDLFKLEDKVFRKGAKARFWGCGLGMDGIARDSLQVLADNNQIEVFANQTLTKLTDDIGPIRHWIVPAHTFYLGAIYGFPGYFGSPEKMVVRIKPNE